MSINLRKTIRMPKALLAKWLKALRSGKYKQAREQLGEEKNGFCCLGLLEHVAGGKRDAYYKVLPSLDWLRRNGVEFTEVDSDGRRFKGTYSPTLCMRNSIPATADSCNDTLGMNFEQIADLVEKRAIGI